MTPSVVPVLELSHEGEHRDTVFVPVHQLDSFLGELSDDYDFGLGHMEVTGARDYVHSVGELGRLQASFKARGSIKTGIKKPVKKTIVPKITATVKPAVYAKLSVASKPASKPASKAPAPTAKPKAPVRAAVLKQKAKGKKPVVLAKKKAKKAALSAQPATLSQVYTKLQAQGKIIDLMQAKREATSEHNAAMARDNFRESVMSILNKLDRQVCGSPNAAYFGRWNKLKRATGVAIQQS
jgi:hypothetical protein